MAIILPEYAEGVIVGNDSSDLHPQFYFKGSCFYLIADGVLTAAKFLCIIKGQMRIPILR